MKFLKAVIYLTGLTSLAWIIPYYSFSRKVKDVLGYVYFNDPPFSDILGKNYLQVQALYQKHITFIELGIKAWGISILIWVVASITLLFLKRNKSILLVVLISFIFHFLSFCYFKENVLG